MDQRVRFLIAAEIGAHLPCRSDSFPNFELGPPSPRWLPECGSALAIAINVVEEKGNDAVLVHANAEALVVLIEIEMIFPIRFFVLIDELLCDRPLSAFLFAGFSMPSPFLVRP